MLQTLELQACPSVDELLKFDGGPNKRTTPTAAFVVDPQLRIQAHHDLHPAILVYDPYLATIGLVEVVRHSTEDYEHQFDRLIEQTAYVRQLSLLASEAKRQSRFVSDGTKGERALTVELVIVFPRDHIAVGTTSVSDVSDILQEVARDTGYLEAIGVSLLYEQPDGGFSTSDARRAFAWLLVATRQWYAEVAAPSNGEAHEGWKLRLDDYRHAGNRTFSFPKGANVHVVHGYNGTGKSSFTEALELVLTGRIDWLEAAGQSAYFPVVRYRRAQVLQPGAVGAAENSDAAAELEIGDARRIRVSISNLPRPGEITDHAWDDGAAALPQPLLSAASFRLD